MFSPGIVPNSTVIVKTENFIGPSPNHKVPMEPSNLFDVGNLTSFEAERAAKIPTASPKSYKKSLAKKHKKKHKGHKCTRIYKFLHRKKKKHKFRKIKKMIGPILLGILILKSVFVSIVLKTLILIASKGLLIGFFSTIMTTVLGFRGAFHDSYGHHHRKNDKIQEIYIYPMKIAANKYYKKQTYKRNGFTRSPGIYPNYLHALRKRT